MDEPRTERHHGLGSLILCILCVWNTLKPFLTGHLSNEQVNERGGSFRVKLLHDCGEERFSSCLNPAVQGFIGVK
jgi:hypothetical protein